ncbi:MAG: prepilin-type N-terminal cleavage/methylation domain-containing protein [Planctomycetota bacterium]
MNNRRGMTLIELLVSMGVLVVLLTFVIMTLSRVMDNWRAAERYHAAADRTSSALRVIESDLNAASVPRFTTGGTERAQFQVRLDGNGNSVLMFTRTIEGGAERAFTWTAGDGLDNTAKLGYRRRGQLGGRSTASRSIQFSRNFDNENFDMINDDNDSDGIDEDLKPLGGEMLIAYFVIDKVLYSKRLSPIPPAFDIQSFRSPVNARILTRNVHYFRIECSSPNSKPGDWSKPLIRWDSTRGQLTQPQFPLASKDRSAKTDSRNDIFPERVRIVLTMDSEGGRSLSTTLDEPISASDTTIIVGDLSGFPAGDQSDSFVRIEDEWIWYPKRDRSRLYLEGQYCRGARLSQATSHPAGARVVSGVQKMRVIELPQYSFFAGGGAREIKP